MSDPPARFWIGRYRESLFLLSFIIMLGGLSVALLISKWSRLLGIGLFGIGLLLFYLVRRAGAPTDREERGFFFQKDEEGRIPIISERIIHLLTFNGRFPQITLIAGIIIMLGVFYYNYSDLRINTYLGSNDFVVILLGLSIGSYHYVPKKYSVERDFMLIFLFLLFLVVVIPTTYYYQTHGTTGGSWEDENPDSEIIHVLLVRPLEFIMRNILDMSVAVDGVQIEYLGNEGKRLTISIALGCTGLYSASIFLSAFISYILVEYRKFDGKVLGLLLLGILTSYVANLLRMVIIIMVGYYYGMDALLTAHANLGELIFMFWIAIFWGLMFKYLDIEVPWEQDEAIGKTIVGRSQNQNGLLSSQRPNE